MAFFFYEPFFGLEKRTIHSEDGRMRDSFLCVRVQVPFRPPLFYSILPHSPLFRSSILFDGREGLPEPPFIRRHSLFEAYRPPLPPIAYYCASTSVEVKSFISSSIEAAENLAPVVECGNISPTL